jgi:hypothetical protein
MNDVNIFMELSFRVELLEGREQGVYHPSSKIRTIEALLYEESFMMHDRTVTLKGDFKNPTEAFSHIGSDGKTLKGVGVPHNNS